MQAKQIQANGELENNGALQAKNGGSSLTQHFNSRSSSPVPGIAMEPSSESPAGDLDRGLSPREMLILGMLTSNKAIARKLVIIK
jgi:hypothetical protein